MAEKHADKHDDHHAAHGDHGHDAHEGGHEIDKMPNARLFNLLFGLSGLTLLACIGVIQLFNLQVDAIEETRAETGSFRIDDYRGQMRKQAEGWGKVEVKELDDKASVSERYYMPLAQAKKRVLDSPDSLKAQPTYPGWKTSDEQAPAAVAPTAPPTPTPPTDVQPPKPTPEKPAEPVTDGKAEETKVEKKPPPRKPPADEKKADDKAPNP
jgi:hypothetical protein